MTINSIWGNILFNKKKEYNYRGRLLTLGRQGIEIESESVKKLYGTVFSMIGKVEPEHLFRFLGFETCDSMDIADKDGANIIHNLNEEIPKKLEHQYDFVIDGGTMEHCFNISNVLSNLARMLKKDGTVIHLNHTQGYSNHGLYNFQPTLYYSFYKTNHFKDMECLIIEFVDINRKKARIISVQNFNNLDFNTSNDCLILFKAVRGKIELIAEPIQEFYYNILKEKQRNNGAIIEDKKYEKIVGNVPENSYENIVKDAQIVELD